MRKTLTVAVAATMLMAIFSVNTVQADSSNEPVMLAGNNAQIKWIGGQSVHYMAATRQSGRIDWKRNATVLLTKGNKSVWVKQSDFCAGDGCADMDISDTAFNILGDTSTGILKVSWACGKKGDLPDNKCVR